MPKIAIAAINSLAPMTRAPLTFETTSWYNLNGMTHQDQSDEAKVDAELWFTMEPSCEGRHFILYNSHTFPGRFTAWCPLKRKAVNVSKSDVRECSQQATYWLKGFLSGAE